MFKARLAHGRIILSPQAPAHSGYPSSSGYRCCQRELSYGSTQRWAQLRLPASSVAVAADDGSSGGWVRLDVQSADVAEDVAVGVGVATVAPGLTQPPWAWHLLPPWVTLSHGLDEACSLACPRCVLALPPWVLMPPLCVAPYCGGVASWCAAVVAVSCLPAFPTVLGR